MWFFGWCHKSNQRSLYHIVKLLSSQWWKQVFQNFNFHSKARVLSLGTSTIICFPSRDRIALFTVKKIPANNQVWVIILGFVLASYNNGVPWNRRASSGCSSITTQSGALWWLPISSHRHLKKQQKSLLKGSRYN